MYGDYDELSLGTTPTDENCAQVGQDTYYSNTNIEARAFIAQLKRAFGKPPPSVYFKVVSCPHDFGIYHDVVVRYNNTIQEAVDYAYKCEDETPRNWDAKARKELKEKGYSF
jgi:hypothetical protein